MKLEKVAGFDRIYQVDSFPNEFNAMFGKNKGEQKRYLQWLYTWLTVLDSQGQKAITLQQFEYLLDTDDPRLYAIRHPHSQINERYIYVYVDDDAAVLLTAFMEKVLTITKQQSLGRKEFTRNWRKMTMKIRDKISNTQVNTWFIDELSDDERRAAEYIAAIAVSIQQERRSQGLTQKEFANRLGVSQTMVSQWENGEKNFTVSTLVKISLALGLQLCNPLSA